MAAKWRKVKYECNDARTFIGKAVQIHIDRPLGTRHPDHGFIYPVNYGFVPGVTGLDGEEMDAYVLGVDVPVERFTGRCIAVIQRLNDADDKLVIVPEGKHFSDKQIRALTAFQEQFFESTISRDVIVTMMKDGSAKPPVLFHGRAQKHDRLEPRPAHGVGPEEDKLTAVYATHLKNLAIAFSIPIIPNEKGGLSFSVDPGVERPEDLNEETEPRIDLEVGVLELDRPGYVYVLPSDSFEQIDPWQWASTTSVAPLDVIEIDPNLYAHWIRDRRPGGV